MTARSEFHYEAKQVDDIVVRPFSFEFPDDLDPVWAPENRVRSLLFNGLSLTMPYLEPFLIRTVKEAGTHIEQPELLADIRGFNGQEARHYQCHRRLNELLKANGYPELAETEARLEAAYKRLDGASLEKRLAYSTGFESMTNGFTHWFIEKRREIFGGTCPYVSSFWLMHMVEETEHKTVAFDAYMACSGRYWPRFIGVFHGSFHVFGYGVIGMFRALRAEGSLYRPRTLAGIVRELASVAWNVGPYLLRALLPGYNPRCEDDPQWFKDWIAGHARLAPGARLPLVDTRDPDMPVPFPEATETA